MNYRQVFEKVKTHLLMQKAKSFVGRPETCAYRGDNGLMCAIGCLIKDEFFDPSSNKFDLFNSRVVSMLECSLNETLTYEDLGFLSILQEIHDNEEPKDWPVALDNLERQLISKGLM